MLPLLLLFSALVKETETVVVGLDVGATFVKVFRPA